MRNHLAFTVKHAEITQIGTRYATVDIGRYRCLVDRAVAINLQGEAVGEIALAYSSP